MSEKAAQDTTQLYRLSQKLWAKEAVKRRNGFKRELHAKRMNDERILLESRERKGRVFDVEVTTNNDK